MQRDNASANGVVGFTKVLAVGRESTYKVHTPVVNAQRLGTPPHLYSSSQDSSSGGASGYAIRKQKQQANALKQANLVANIGLSDSGLVDEKKRTLQTQQLCMLHDCPAIEPEIKSKVAKKLNDLALALCE